MIPSPSINSIQIGPLTIHLYGLILALAITAAYVLANKLATKYSFTSNQIDKYFFIVIPISIVFARIYHILTNFSSYLNNPLSMIYIWKGGIGILGAIIGALLTIKILSKKYNQSFLTVTDFFAPLLAIGQAIGRWGNYFNQELYGKPSTVPWAIQIDPKNRIEKYSTYTTFHPTFFYESILSLLNFAVLFYLAKKRQLRIGTITALYSINYGIIRLIVESFKLDPDINSTLGPLRIPQYLSIIMIIFGIFLLLSNKNK